MKERIYYSIGTGKIYGELANGRINTRTAIKRDLSEYTLVSENQNFHTYEKEVLPPLLLGNEAMRFYQSKPSGFIRLDLFLINPKNKLRGYFKGVKAWIAFDFTGDTWKEEEFEEQALCIEWFKN